MGVSAKGVISGTRVVSKYHYTMALSETDVDMSPFYGKDQLVLYTDPLYQNPVYSTSDYFGYIFNADGTMRNYLTIIEDIGSGDDYPLTNDGWYYRDYNWSRTGNFVAASRLSFSFDSDGALIVDGLGGETSDWGLARDVTEAVLPICCSRWKKHRRSYFDG